MLKTNCKSCDQQVSVTEDQIKSQIECSECKSSRLTPNVKNGLDIEEDEFSIEPRCQQVSSTLSNGEGLPAIPIQPATNKFESELPPIPVGVKLSTEPKNLVMKSEIHKSSNERDTALPPIPKKITEPYVDKIEDLEAELNRLKHEQTDPISNTKNQSELPKHVKFVKESIFLFLKRCNATQAIKTSPTEVETKMLNQSGIYNDVDQIEFLWRKSFLFMASIMIGLAALLTLFDFFEDMGDDTLSGINKNILVFFPFIMLLTSGYKSIRAYLNWNKLEESKRCAQHSALALSSQLILLSFLPISEFQDFYSNEEKLLFAVIIAAGYGILFIPVMIGLVMGLIRGCLVARVFHMDTPVYGSMLLVASWLSFVIFLFISGIIVQSSSSFCLAIAFIFLIILTIMNSSAGYKLKEKLSKKKVLSIVSEIEKSSPILFGLATIFALIGGWSLFEQMEISFWSILKFIINLVGSFSILTVAFYDLVTTTKKVNLNDVSD